MRGIQVTVIALLAGTAGCELYFHHPVEDDLYIPPDAYVWVPDEISGGSVARCEDGNIFTVQVPDYAPTQPEHGAGVLIGHCPHGCSSAAVVCSGASCANAVEALCDTPASAGKPCDLQGTACSGSGSISCPETTTCGYAEPGSTCTCSSNSYQCAALTDAATTQAAMVGKWTGTVNPPSFSQPYQVSLWIYADGTYWAESAPGKIAFYYGGDGPYPDRKISILSTSATEGSWADIGIYFGSSPANTGALSALTVDATHLRFTFFASWFGCGQPFYFDLTRAN